MTVRAAGLAAAVVLVATVAVPTSALAQVNTEKLRSWDSEGFGGAVDFSLFLRSGNVDLLVVGTGLRLQYVTLHPTATATSATAKPPPRKVKDLVLLIGNLSLGIRSDERYLNNGFSHLRWTRMWIPRLGSELFAQLQYNEFLRLKQRLLLGAGVRAIPVDESWGEIAVGSAPMLEIEEVSEDLGVEEAHTMVGRWSNYVSLKLYVVDPAVQLVNTVYVQPRFADFGDYRVLNEGEIGVQVTDALELVIAASILYDSRPPATVKKLDTTFTNSVRVTF